MKGLCPGFVERGRGRTREDGEEDGGAGRWGMGASRGLCARVLRYAAMARERRAYKCRQLENNVRILHKDMQG